MTATWIAVLTALFAWWFATGAILAVVKRADAGGRKSHLWAVLLALPVLVLGIGLFADTLDRTEPFAVFAAFLAALMIWGWIEMAFLCGVIAGPNRWPTPQGAGGAERFWRAWGAVAHHELLLAGTAGAMLWIAWGAPNPFAALIFAVLWGARILAKLNLFLGVPRINTEFLPEALAHLPTHFRRRPMTAFLPVSILVLAAATAWFAWAAAVAPDPYLALGWTLAAAIAGLAALEHLLMVVPLPDAQLWRWLLPAADPETSPKPPRERAD
mgnify:FL=1